MKKAAPHMAASGGRAAGCGTQSADRNPHSGTASPLHNEGKKSYLSAFLDGTIMQMCVYL